MKVVVFGGSGFLGSHVCDKLEQAGHEVIIFDKVDSPWRGPNQKFIAGDILNFEQIKKSLKNADAVFNFAGIADIDQAKLQPIETVQYNILGNVNILQACKEENVKRFIFASTVYVYSKSGSFYRASKQASEEYIHEYARQFDLNYTILRYGSLYGSRADERNGIHRFVSSAVKNGEITYEGDLAARRDYIHVEDAARASVEILDDKYTNENIILTGAQTLKIGDVFKMIEEMLNKEVNISALTPKKGSSHYTMTPYSFNPKPGRKFVPPLQIDFGQGLLNVIEDIYHNAHKD